MMIALPASARSPLVSALGGIALALSACTVVGMPGPTTAPRPAASASPTVDPSSLPVIPAAEGFGITTPAGRGGQIIRVTSLLAVGPGSLQAALQAEGARVIVFEVGGIIRLTHDLEIENPFVTVAGQTAPAPGITLAGAGLSIRTHDVLVQHVRVRVGDAPGGEEPGSRDGIEIVGSEDGSREAYNIIIDHCSVSWAIDEGLSTFSDNVHDVTIRNCIIAENLSHSLHPKGEHSKGMLIGNFAQRIAVVGNLFAHNFARNPLIKGAASTVIVNNLVYNPNSRFVHLQDDIDSGPSFASIVGNVFVPGPDTPGDTGAITLESGLAEGTRVYLADNAAPTRPDDPWSIVDLRTEFDPRAAAPPVWPDEFAVLPSDQVLAWVLANAGARPAGRDAVDARVAANVLAGDGQIIDSPAEVGGLPEAAAVTRTLALPENPHGDDDGDGYTNLEEWLHALAAEVEAGGK